MAEERRLFGHVRNCELFFFGNGRSYREASSGDGDGDCRARRRVASERSVDIVCSSDKDRLYVEIGRHYR